MLQIVTHVMTIDQCWNQSFCWLFWSSTDLVPILFADVFSSPFWLSDGGPKDAIVEQLQDNLKFYILSPHAKGTYGPRGVKRLVSLTNLTVIPPTE